MFVCVACGVRSLVCVSGSLCTGWGPPWCGSWKPHRLHLALAETVEAGPLGPISQPPHLNSKRLLGMAHSLAPAKALFHWRGVTAKVADLKVLQCAAMSAVAAIGRGQVAVCHKDDPL